MGPTGNNLIWLAKSCPGFNKPWQVVSPAKGLGVGLVCVIFFISLHAPKGYHRFHRQTKNLSRLKGTMIEITKLVKTLHGGGHAVEILKSLDLTTRLIRVLLDHRLVWLRCAAVCCGGWFLFCGEF